MPTNTTAKRKKFLVPDIKLTEEDIDRLFDCDAIKGIDTIALRGGEPLDEPNNIYIIQKLEQ